MELSRYFPEFELIVYNNASDLPENIRNQMIHQGATPERVKAWVDDDQTLNKVYLIAGNTPPSEVAATLGHEIIGHRGLRAVFGEQFNDLLDLVYRDHAAEIDSYAERYLRNPENNVDNQRYLTEEFLADCANLSEKPSWWKEFIAKIRAWLRQFKPGLQFTNRDIEGAISLAYRRVRRGGMFDSAVVKENLTTENGATSKGNLDVDGVRYSVGAEKSDLSDGDVTVNNGNKRDLTGIFVDKISEDYFQNPDKDVQLQALPDMVLSVLNKPNKPLVLKKNIVEKNKTHADLSEEDILEILGDAIYNCDLIIQPNPQNKPGYFMLISRGVKSKQTLLEISESKEQYEIVNYHYLGERQLRQKIKRATEQNGIVKDINRDGLPNSIITQKGAAGRFSALPVTGTISQSDENANPNLRFSVSEDETDFNGNERNITDNPNFKRWFADSKVVDDNGEPLVVYHGTDRYGFTVFREDSHFSADYEYAKRYSNKGRKNTQSGVYAVYLSIKNPFDIRNAEDRKIFTEYRQGHTPAETRSGAMDWAEYDFEDFREFLQENYPDKYDGVILDEGSDSAEDHRGIAYVPFSPEQIKSATDNVGTFDSSNPDIRFLLAEFTPEERRDITLILKPYVGFALNHTDLDYVQYLADRGVNVSEKDAHAFAVTAMRENIDEANQRNAEKRKAAAAAARERRDQWIYANTPLYREAVEFAGTKDFKIKPSGKFRGEDFSGSFISPEFVKYSRSKKKDDSKLDSAAGVNSNEFAAALARKWGRDELQLEQEIVDYFRDLKKTDLFRDYSDFRKNQILEDKEADRLAYEEALKIQQSRVEEEVIHILEHGLPITEEYVLQFCLEVIY